MNHHLVASSDASRQKLQEEARYIRRNGLHYLFAEAVAQLNAMPPGGAAASPDPTAAITAIFQGLLAEYRALTKELSSVSQRLFFSVATRKGRSPSTTIELLTAPTQPGAAIVASGPAIPDNTKLQVSASQKSDIITTIVEGLVKPNLVGRHVTPELRCPDTTLLIDGRAVPVMKGSDDSVHPEVLRVASEVLDMVRELRCASAGVITSELFF